MNEVKNVFSIKDLENISGIKAHTIRIWEKRYEILAPLRSDTNIRYYDIYNLQKLLNITLLHDYGYKISRISKLKEDQIPEIVREIITEKSAKSHAISAFKMAMMNFDQVLFIQTYDDLLLEKTFRDVFFDVFVPLMTEIGLLWQSNTISAAHEHFLSYLFKQKILLNTEKLQHNPPTKLDQVFVLYLPEDEIHELGLMYLNYELVSSGYKTIYLGQSVPVDNLKDVVKYFDKITFVGYVTVQPDKDNIDKYIDGFNKEVLSDTSNEHWLIGRMVETVNTDKLNYNTKLFNSIKDLSKYIE
jgi:MerR family transcriptional regulator, light-induced transcriptional regulator